ncbi:hypothetical protein HG530_015117 [Fusarium avenaceum]|nr:hypothetical protein HG530_015117 [Fusarium avenaceum]KIL93647.1 hypothetical protein FAVG1_02207 [Fusarium avenaceum]
MKTRTGNHTRKKDGVRDERVEYVGERKPNVMARSLARAATIIRKIANMMIPLPRRETWILSLEALLREQLKSSVQNRSPDDYNAQTEDEPPQQDTAALFVPSVDRSVPFPRPCTGANYEKHQSVISIPAPLHAHTSARSPETLSLSPVSTYHGDGFGELDPDGNGELRYVGLGSTATIVDRCAGLRRHIDEGLHRKGHSPGETFLTSPHTSATSSIHSDRVAALLPNDATVQQLFRSYFKQLAFAFPVITESDVRASYDKIRTKGDVDISVAAVVFSLLIAATPMANAELRQHSGETVRPISPNAATAMYDRALELTEKATRVKSSRFKNLHNVVIAYALQALYLAETGSQAEAWMTVGRAIRKGQDLGLHRSPNRLQIDPQARNQRIHLWWSLYILEAQLCTALGRPLSIDDADCDVEKPTEPLCGANGQTTAGFIALIELQKVLRGILKTINPIQNARRWTDIQNYQQIRTKVSEHHTALQIWAKDQLPPEIKMATSGLLMTKRYIFLSCFSTALLLLYRCFMPQPHKASALDPPQVQRTCSRYATSYIQGSADFLHHVPLYHYFIFHGQNLFVSASVLLQCVRHSQDAEFVRSALKDVGTATMQLRIMENEYTGALRSRAVIDEYVDITLNMQRGLYTKGVCNFSCQVDRNLNLQPTVAAVVTTNQKKDDSLQSTNNTPVVTGQETGADGRIGLKRKQCHGDEFISHQKDGRTSQIWALDNQSFPAPNSFWKGDGLTVASGTLLDSAGAGIGSGTPRQEYQVFKGPTDSDFSEYFFTMPGNTRTPQLSDFDDLAGTFSELPEFPEHPMLDSELGAGFLSLRSDSVFTSLTNDIQISE